MSDASETICIILEVAANKIDCGSDPRVVFDRVHDEILDALQDEEDAQPTFTSGEAFTVPAGDTPIASWVNMGGPIDRSGGDAAFILALMSQMTEQQRHEAINAITIRYCAGCGTLNEPSRCQCRNDE